MIQNFKMKNFSDVNYYENQVVSQVSFSYIIVIREKVKMLTCIQQRARLCDL